MISRGETIRLMDQEYERNRTRADRLIEKALWLYLWPLKIIGLKANIYHWLRNNG